MSDQNVEFSEEDSFIVIKFIGQNSTAFQPVFNNANPLQLFAIAEYLKWVATTQMDEEHKQRSKAKPEIQVASTLPPNMRNA